MHHARTCSLISRAAESAPLHHQQHKIEPEFFRQQDSALVVSNEPSTAGALLDAIQQPLAIGRKTLSCTLLSCATINTLFQAHQKRAPCAPQQQHPFEAPRQGRQRCARADVAGPSTALP
jgi:hypothetical protein